MARRRGRRKPPNREIKLLLSVATAVAIPMATFAAAVGFFPQESRQFVSQVPVWLSQAQFVSQSIDSDYARTGGTPVSLPPLQAVADFFNGAMAAVQPNNPGMPSTFDHSKRMLRSQVMPKLPAVDYYCECSFTKSLQVIASSCPLVASSFVERSARIEFEHIVPASDFGHQRDCWRNKPSGMDGRTHCRNVDETFRTMEADPFNLIPVVGSLNAIRSNHRFGMVPRGTESPVVSGCGFKVSSPPGRFIEPPDNTKGLVARTYFYMESRYGLSISRSQRQLFQAWDRQFPADANERLRAQLIQRATGVGHPFVSQ